MRSGAVPLLGVLLLAFPLFLAADYAYRRGLRGFAGDAKWTVDADRSYIELAGYMQVLVAAALVLVVGRRDRVPVLLGWAAVLLVLVLDDALALHERGAVWLDDRLGLPSVLRLRPHDLGEFIVWAVLGSLSLVVLAATHVASDPDGRRRSWRLLALVGLLAVFAVALDMVHVAAAGLESGSFNLGFIWVEEAGELGAMSALLAFVVHEARRAPATIRAVHVGRSR